MHNDFKVDDIVSFNDEASNYYRYTNKESNCIGRVLNIQSDKQIEIEILEISDKFKQMKGEIESILTKFAIYEGTYEEYINKKRIEKEANCNLNNLLLNGF